MQVSSIIFCSQRPLLEPLALPKIWTRRAALSPRAKEQGYSLNLLELDQASQSACEASIVVDSHLIALVI
jgi:hypothetical protein